MNIFLAFLQSPKKHPIAAYDFGEYYIKNRIEESGDQWCESEGAYWALGLVPQSAKKALNDHSIPASIKKIKTWS